MSSIKEIWPKNVISTLSRPPKILGIQSTYDYVEILPKSDYCQPIPTGIKQAIHPILMIRYHSNKQL